MKLYVGMGLTQAPKEFREDFQHKLKQALKAIKDVEILDFVGLEGSTKEEVYRYDRACSEKADLCVFICDHPSIGLGMEIVFRLQLQKPMILFAGEGVVVTRMLTGMCAVEKVPFLRYTDAQQIALRVNEYRWS